MSKQSDRDFATGLLCGIATRLGWAETAALVAELAAHPPRYWREAPACDTLNTCETKCVAIPSAKNAERGLTPETEHADLLSVDLVPEVGIATATDATRS